MTRIANVNVPVNKKLYISLTYVHGIGVPSSNKICQELGIKASKKVKDLTENELSLLRDKIEKEYKVEGDLRREVQMNVKYKKDMKSYQGRRHIMKLPVRGQSTHNNARTRKGKAVPIAGKKK